jgi:hypothetical protein
MVKQSKAQKETIERVMHEFKHGELESSSGATVKNPKQAIAIALHEAGASNEESEEKNRQNLKRTKARERSGETARGETGGTGRKSAASGRTREALYAEARQRQIAGRSRMNKAELQRALQS